MIMDIQRIMELLPHRYPFLLVDRVRSVDAENGIVALKNVTMNEPFFPGHYPHHPIMPGVLIVEAMAQAAALLLFHTADGGQLNENTLYYFVGIDGARFKRPVVPGDQLILKAKLLRGSRGLYKFAVSAEVDGQLSAEAEIMCAVRARE